MRLALLILALIPAVSTISCYYANENNTFINQPTDIQNCPDASQKCGIRTDLYLENNFMSIEYGCDWGACGRMVDIGTCQSFTNYDGDIVIVHCCCDENLCNNNDFFNVNTDPASSSLQLSGIIAIILPFSTCNV